MARKEEMYIANLSFLLNYDEGKSNDEIEYEIFKAAWQDKESVHYDRIMGGNFRDLEQEPSNLAVGLKFVSNLVKSVYYVNNEKKNDPYIVVGSDNIIINNEVNNKSGEYIVQVQYSLLQDISTEGTISV
jgi:hypothetical protein